TRISSRSLMWQTGKEVVAQPPGGAEEAGFSVLHKLGERADAYATPAYHPSRCSNTLMQDFDGLMGNCRTRSGLLCSSGTSCTTTQLSRPSSFRPPDQDR